MKFTVQDIIKISFLLHEIPITLLTSSSVEIRLGDQDPNLPEKCLIFKTVPIFPMKMHRKMQILSDSDPKSQPQFHEMPCIQMHCRSIDA